MTGASEKRLIRAALLVAVAVYLTYSTFGIAAPFWWGHYGYHGATYLLRARTSLRLHIIAPATWTGWDPPGPGSLYFHHPIGYHHIYTLLIPILGDHEWLARGGAAVGGLFALWGIWAVARRFWGEWAALAGVWIFVLLPVVTSFSILCDPMLLALGCVLWSLNVYLQLLEKPSRRLLIHAGISYALGGLIMWESYFLAPLIALHAFVLRWRRPDIRRWLDLHTIVIGGACALMMAFHIWFTWKSGALAESMDSYKLRHAAPSLQYVFDRHATWISLLFGWPCVAAASLWCVVFLARLSSGRARSRDLVPLAFLYINSLYIYLFAEGSSVHLYRVFFYSGFFTFAVIDLLDSAARAAKHLGGRRAAIAAAAVASVAWFAAEAPRAFGNLIESRVVGGTHGNGGYNPEREKGRFAVEVHRRTTPDERVILHYPNLGARKELWYYIDRSLDEITELRQADRYQKTWSKSVLIFDHHLSTPAELAYFRTLAAKHPVAFFGHWAMVDLRRDVPGVESWGFTDGPMSRAYRFFVSHKYPPAQLKPEAYLPGICDVLDADPPPPAGGRAEPIPPAPPAHERARLACHARYLAWRGEAAAAESEIARLTSGLTRIDRPFGRGQLIAAGIVAGKLQLVVRGAGPEAAGIELHVAVRQPGRRPIELPATLVAPQHWQPGFVYTGEATLPPLGKNEKPIITIDLLRGSPQDGPTPAIAHIEL